VLLSVWIEFSSSRVVVDELTCGHLWPSVRPSVAVCGRLWHFVAVCGLLWPFVPFGSFCVLVTDTSLNVSFSISVVVKYQIQNRDFSKCQFVPKMTKTS
jgi:hypothetical protein